MHITYCPRCAHPEQIELRPLARTGQRWTGLVVAFWFLILLWMWGGTNGALFGMSFGFAEDAKSSLATFIQQRYETAHPEEVGGAYQTTVQNVQVISPTGALPLTQLTPGQPLTIKVPALPAMPIQTDVSTDSSTQNTTDTSTLESSTPDKTPTAAATPAPVPNVANPSVQIIPTGPGRQIVLTIQDDDLRNRFARWWAGQDPKAILADAGGFSIIPWRELWYWLPLGLVFTAMGIVWSVALLNLNRKRLMIALPILGMWYLMGVIVMMLFLPHSEVLSPRAASFALLMPRLVPFAVLFFGGMLLLGLLIGRFVVRQFVRLALSPRATSTLTQLWLVDGHAPPRVMPRPLSSSR